MKETDMTPGEVARRLDRVIAAWIADALDGEPDQASAKAIFETCASAASTALLLDERQAQLDSREKSAPL